MKKTVALVLVVLVAIGVGGVVGAAPSRPRVSTPQSDSAVFTLLYPTDTAAGDTLYCGVADNAEPFELKVAVSNPPVLDDLGEVMILSGYERVGWLAVGLQSGESFGPPSSEPRPEFFVPANGSWSFDLTLGGRPLEDQLVQISSPELGDPWGGGSPMFGYATVRANPDATDPFEGDDATDNFCVTIGFPTDDASKTQGGSWEFREGEISTSLPVPDLWVVDGDGDDGGILRGIPH